MGVTTSHCSGWFPLSRNFSVRTRVKLTCVNETVVMYERPVVNVKAEGGLTFMLRVTFHTLPLFYARA